MIRLLTGGLFALSGLASCDSIGEPVGTAPLVYRETSRLSSSNIMRCFERIGVETYFPGVGSFAIAAGRVGAPGSGGYRAEDGTSISVVHEYPNPTIVSIRAHAPLNELQKGMVSKCTQQHL